MNTIMTSAAASVAMSIAFPFAAFADDTPAVVVESYIETVINGRDVDRISEFVAKDLIQHNPNLPNGRAPLKAFWIGFFEQLPDARFTTARTISSGDMVVEHSFFQAALGDVGMAVVDIYRVEDGLIVEHWDVAQPIPEAFASGNHPVLEEN